jgi:hypothetical protein
MQKTRYDQSCCKTQDHTFVITSKYLSRGNIEGASRENLRLANTMGNLRESPCDLGPPDSFA